MFDKFDPQTVEQLAGGQHAVFALWQQGEAGLTRHVLAARVVANHLYRIHQGVYALVPEELLTPNGRRMAAVLACGRDAALSLYSAIKLRGLMDSSRTEIDVTVSTRGGRARHGIRIHRSVTLRPRDVELVQGIPCTTLARTIFDLAGLLSERALERLLDEAVFQEVLDLAALDEQIQHNAGRSKARANLRRALTIHRPGETLTDGPLGEEMLALIRSTDLPWPKLQHWIDLGDDEPMIQADFAWPEVMVIVETDGQQAHGKPLRTVSDYRRDQRAAKAGWHTIRASRQQIRGEPERLKATLTTVIKRRQAQRPAVAPGDPG